MSRLDKFREVMSADTDAYLVLSELNNRYLSGVNYTDGFLLITREKAFLLADSRYIEAAKMSANEQFEVMLLKGKRSDIIKALIPEGSRVGFEDNVLTYAEFSAYEKALPELKFIPCGGVIEKLRNVKDDTEKEYMTKAQRITEGAFNHILDIITPDMTERMVALELEYYMRSHGADGIAFETIAVSGSSSSLPHGIPADRKLEKGFLTMDFGAKYNGYCSDMTRTICIGKPDDEMKRLYDTVLTAQRAAIEYVAAGKKCSDCDKIARDIINGAGYEGRFGHSLGHGVGLFIHEPISVSPMSDVPLCVGNVITAEPGIYIEGKYGVRIEDMLYVTENGCEDLTLAPKELIVI